MILGHEVLPITEILNIELHRKFPVLLTVPTYEPVAFLSDSNIFPLDYRGEPGTF
jgi:hypothetical protein